MTSVCQSVHLTVRLWCGLTRELRSFCLSASGLWCIINLPVVVCLPSVGVLTEPRQHLSRSVQSSVTATLKCRRGAPLGATQIAFKWRHVIAVNRSIRSVSTVLTNWWTFWLRWDTTINEVVDQRAVHRVAVGQPPLTTDHSYMTNYLLLDWTRYNFTVHVCHLPSSHDYCARLVTFL